MSPSWDFTYKCGFAKTMEIYKYTVEKYARKRPRKRYFESL